MLVEIRENIKLRYFSYLGEVSLAIDTNLREIVANSYLGEGDSRIGYEDKSICNDYELEEKLH